MLRASFRLLVPLSLACAADGGSAPPQTSAPATPAPARAHGAEPLLGSTDRGAILAFEPRFSPERAPTPDPEVVARLRSVVPGAEVTVVLGTWCGDSQRELSRWFRTLDEMGTAPPFDVDYLAVSWASDDPRAESLDIEFVPTFVVRRDGIEVGRVVESAPDGIETAILSLLSGEVRGVITGRADLTGVE